MALTPERCPIGLKYYHSPMIVGTDPYASDMLADTHYGTRFDATFSAIDGMRLNPINPYDMYETKTHSAWNQITLSNDFWLGLTTKCHYYNGWTNTVSFVINNTSGSSAIGFTIYHYYGGTRKVSINFFGISGSSLVYNQAHILGDVFKIEYRKQGSSVFFYLNDTLMQEYTYSVTGTISNRRPYLEIYSDGGYPMSRNWVKDIYIVSSTAGSDCQGLVPPEPTPTRVLFPHRILDNKTVLGFKLQSARNDVPAFTLSDYGHLVDEINYDVDIGLYSRKLARNDFSREKSIAGKISAEVSFRLPLYVCANPKWIEYLRACGWSLLESDSQKILRPISSSDLACIHVLMPTDEINPRQHFVKIKNAIGSARLLVEEAVSYLLFSFIGELDDITTLDANNRIVPYGFDVPEVAIGHIATMDGDPIVIDYAEFTSETDVAQQSNISSKHGTDGVLYTARLITAQINCVYDD